MQLITVAPEEARTRANSARRGQHLSALPCDCHGPYLPYTGIRAYCNKVFMKWLKGSWEAKRALNSVAKYVVLCDKRTDGKFLSCLPFGMMALRPVSDSSDSEVVLASLSSLVCRGLFLRWDGFLIVLLARLTIGLR
jgi:hypothetical protein